MSQHLHDAPRQWSIKRYLVGAICVLSAGLIFEQFDGALRQNLMGFAAPLQPARVNHCAKVVQADATLSRAALGKLLTVAEGTSRAQIRAIVKSPYCTLAPLTVRVGATTEREAYPLAFKPDTWLVVIYEGNSYAGFDFLLQ